MEVKGIKNNAAAGTAVSSMQRSLKSLPRVSRPATAEPADSAGSVDSPSSQSSKANSAIQQLDALVNEISGNAEAIGSYVKSLGGILQQGLKESSAVRRAALEKEANQVLRAIREKAVSIKQREGQNTALDPLRSEVEAKLGRTLEMLLPEDLDYEGGLPDLSFSNKDLIISVQTKILRTTQYLDSLREADQKKDAEIKAAIAKAEVAQINAESSRTSLRDVDSAFKLVEETTRLIGEDRDTALFAIGDVREQIDVTG